MWSGLDEQLIAHGAEGLKGNVSTWEGGLEPNPKLAKEPEGAAPVLPRMAGTG